MKNTGLNWLGGVAACLVMIPSLAHGQDGRFEYRSENGVERSDPFIDSDTIEPGGVSDLETGIDSNTWLRWVQPTGQGRVWRFEQQVRLRAFDDRDDLNSVLLTPRIQYWTPVGENWQARFNGSASWMQRDGDTHYTRLEGEGQLRYRGVANRETVIRLRHTNYDFGDQVVAGLDQSQWRAGIEQFWYSEDRRGGARADLYYKTADADADRFSHDEWRARARAWTPLGMQATGHVQLELVERDYDGAFSLAEPFARSDSRWEAVAGAERPFGDRFSLYGEAGYVDNDSNIASRSYSGAIFRIGFRVQG
ncbi:hypothetical protein [Maricaulis parjimensis]|uniref:hypothetical protein n=1 Tax=Maricaulis parjimensis TaxID=144023 RepID=UPI001939F02E|nr:hypothetical protein [Maricaulis parjimensis]